MQLDMGIGAFAVVIVTALILGFLVQAFLQPKTPYEWLITGVGAAVGGWLASEITWTQWFTRRPAHRPGRDGRTRHRRDLRWGSASASAL